MSKAILERAILNGARTALNNQSLRKKDIEAWSSDPAPINKGLEAGEIMVFIPHVSEVGVYICVHHKCDKRKPEKK